MLNEVQRKAFGGLLRLLISVTALLFVAAGTLKYWQAWLFISVFFTSIFLITLYLIRKDPKLLERRVKRTEQKGTQRIIQYLASLAFGATIILPALDHRRSWSHMPPAVDYAGDGLVALGLLIVFIVFKENTFTSAIIEVHPEQRVISTGLYARVRHPMYSGALIMLLGMPLALGSWWGLLTLVPMTVIIVWRLLDEEAFLSKSLPGYAEYRSHTKYRLVPFVW